MKLVTIQNRKVLNKLITGQTFISDFDHIIKSPFDNITEEDEIIEAAKIKAYQVLMKHYHFNTPPIFCCVVGRVVNFGDFKSSNNILLELEVPDKSVHLHLYDKWIDIVRYIACDIWNEESYNKFKEYLDGKLTNHILPIQAVIPFILPSWLINAYEIDNYFTYKYKNIRLIESDYTSNKIYWR